jgi:RNA-directed DNA polymerase
MPAVKAGFSEQEIAALVLYNERLLLQKLPVIFDYRHLSVRSGYSTKFIYSVTNDPERFYRRFYIKKRSGGSRCISAPLPDLKNFQRWLADEFGAGLPVSKFAHAFRNGHSIKTNARFHIGRRTLIKLDLVDYFGSFSTIRLYEYFRKLGYTDPVSALLASLSTLRGALPQGSPCSPLLANALTYDLDHAIAALALPLGWRFTRYADDLTFSGDGDARSFLNEIEKVIVGQGFVVNHSKTRTLGSGSRQITCGVIVNSRMAPSRQSLRAFKQEIYYIRKFGLQAHLDHRQISEPNYLDVLLGKAEHLRWMSEHLQDVVASLRADIEYLRSLRPLSRRARFTGG